MPSIKLVVKSESQYNKTVAELDSLGARGFFKSGYRDKPNWGICVWSDGTYTDGIKEGTHTQRKKFIQDVKTMLGKE